MTEPPLLHWERHIVKSKRDGRLYARYTAAWKVAPGKHRSLGRVSIPLEDEANFGEFMVRAAQRQAGQKTTHR